MTAETLLEATRNRDKYQDYENIRTLIEDMFGKTIRLECAESGSFRIPKDIASAVLETILNYVDEEMARLDNKFKEM